MRKADSAQELNTVVRQRPADASKQIGLAVIALFAMCAGTALRDLRAAAFTNKVTLGPTTSDYLKLSAVTSIGDYSKFSHSSPKEHADLMGRNNCGSCHRRNDVSPEVRFPLHKDCTGCHMVQFISPNNSSSINPICTICHQAEGLNSPSAPLKNSLRLASFTADFDHAQHLQGTQAARPARGCATCHGPTNRGVAESIPARLNAHTVCYECHSPGKQASQYSSCGSCHRLGRYAPTSTAARAFRLGFSHADHGPRARLNCERCHEVRGRGLPQARQISSIAPVQHVPNARACVSCHDGQRAFGEQVKGNFENCRRCHKGVKFGS